jgi:hypothetical protein
VISVLAKEIRKDTALRERFAKEILAHRSVVTLADECGGPAARYTTRVVLEAEQYVLGAAAALVHDRKRHAASGHEAPV